MSQFRQVYQKPGLEILVAKKFNSENTSILLSFVECKGSRIFYVSGYQKGFKEQNFFSCLRIDKYSFKSI